MWQRSSYSFWQPLIFDWYWVRRSVPWRGGIVYAVIMVHNGIWEKGLSKRETIWRDCLTSMICAGIFAMIYSICLRRMGATEKQMVHLALMFFIGISIVAFVVLRMLSCFNQKKSRS